MISAKDLSDEESIIDMLSPEHRSSERNSVDFGLSEDESANDNDRQDFDSSKINSVLMERGIPLLLYLLCIYILGIEFIEPPEEPMEILLNEHVIMSVIFPTITWGKIELFLL